MLYIITQTITYTHTRGEGGGGGYFHYKGMYIHAAGWGILFRPSSI